MSLQALIETHSSAALYLVLTLIWSALPLSRFVHSKKRLWIVHFLKGLAPFAPLALGRFDSEWAWDAGFWMEHTYSLFLGLVFVLAHIAFTTRKQHKPRGLGVSLGVSAALLPEALIACFIGVWATRVQKAGDPLLRSWQEYVGVGSAWVGVFFWRGWTPQLGLAALWALILFVRQSEQLGLILEKQNDGTQRR